VSAPESSPLHLPDPTSSPLRPRAEFCIDLVQRWGERFSGPIAILRNWTFCLFYVMAELWGSVVVSVLFWGLANTVTTVDEAERFYPLFGLVANVSLIFSGQAVRHFSDVRSKLPPGIDGWGVSLRGMMSMVVAFGLFICALRRYVEVTTIRKMEGQMPIKKVRPQVEKTCALSAGKCSVQCLAGTSMRQAPEHLRSNSMPAEILACSRACSSRACS
jgi:ATP:ADP antiporter, AAA family